MNTMSLHDPVQVAPRPPPTETEPQSRVEQVLLAVFVGVPFAALAVAAPVAWGRALGWHDVVIALIAYMISGLGVTVGFHRYFTHGAFKALRPLRVALAVAGSLSIEGPIIQWVADH